MAEPGLLEGRRVLLGLGNPGPRFDETRHNVGFELIDRVAEALSWPIRRQLFRPLALSRGSRPLILAKPLTYMNRSGQVINWLSRRVDQPSRDILVIVDNMDLPPGQVRMKRRGSSAGHNGLKSIEMFLGSDYPRIYIGVGRPPQGSNIIDHVLSTGDESERAAIDAAIGRLADLLAESWSLPIDSLISAVNDIRYPHG